MARIQLNNSFYSDYIEHPHHPFYKMIKPRHLTMDFITELTKSCEPPPFFEHLTTITLLHPPYSREKLVILDSILPKNTKVKIKGIIKISEIPIAFFTRIIEITLEFKGIYILRQPLISLRRLNLHLNLDFKEYLNPLNKKFSMNCFQAIRNFAI